MSLSLPVLCIAAFLLTGAVADSVDDQFASFIVKHERLYKVGTSEYHERLSTYQRHAAEVNALNGRPLRWKAGLNHMADWHDHELTMLLGWKGAAVKSSGGGGGMAMGFLASNRRAKLPDSIDWSKNVSMLSTAVDQGGCGSCWAVATTRLLAAHSEIYGGESKRTFSTQELVDCTPNKFHCGGKGGCQGATVTLALNYVMLHGDATIAENGYKGTDTTCKGAEIEALNSDAVHLSNEDILAPGIHLAGSTVGTRGLEWGMTGWERIPENKELPLKTALVDRGPVGVSVDASGWSWYSSGIFDDCSKDAVINHAVLMVGYGEATADKYWMIQNSWGPNWGEQGIIRMLRHDNEEEWCGIDHQPADGSGCDDGPTQVPVCGMCGVLYESAVPHMGAKTGRAEAFKV